MMPPNSVTFDAVELRLDQGVSCFGECAMAGSPSEALCVVLHDEGDDLDSLRWLSLLLLAQGISQLLVDLPGHGLSGGNTSDHLEAALQAAQAFASSIGCTTVGFVAKGATSHSMLLTEQTAAPVAAVLVSPVAKARGSLEQHVSWERVPKLAFIPGDDRASAAFADTVVRHTHAWCLRANLAFDRGSDQIPAAAQTQIGSIAAKFLLEQIAFAQAAQSSSRQPDERPPTTASGGLVHP
jgi:hypothetical protein